MLIRSRRRTVFTGLFLLFGLSRPCRATESYPAAQPLPLPVAKRSYVVITTRATHEKKAWSEVAQILRQKHDADLVIVPDAHLESALPTLQRLHPRYVAFVLRPEEAGRETVVRIHRMLRRVDEDPYNDTLWGILTGFEAGDARRIAETTEPLTISSAFSSMGPGMAEGLGAGFASSEGSASTFWQIREDGSVEERAVSPDPTAALAEAFAKHPPQIMVTSGHATERDWQIGYSVKAGQIRCDKGQLYTLGVDRTRRNFTSPGSKVYLPMGNCLIGHCDGPDSMVAAWLHTGGVTQMYGYTAVTFYGYMGWGVNTYFSKGEMSLAQAFHANGHALLNQLNSRFRPEANLRVRDYSHQRINQTAQELGVRDKDLFGMLWDRDAVAFYGDPAWVARMPVVSRSWRAELIRSPSKEDQQRFDYRFTLTTTVKGEWPNRPVVVPLGERLSDISGLRASGFTATGKEIPVVTDDFILLPLSGEYGPESKVELQFTACVAEPVATSAAHPAMDLTSLSDADQTVLGTCPRELQPALTEALLRAGENRVSLIKALREIGKTERAAMSYLIANMPARDLYTIEAGLLIEHVTLAWQAWQDAPWRADVSEALFLDAILPYACLDETREAWMPDLRKRSEPLVKGCRTSGEAALALNGKLFSAVNVSYHASKRPRPNQSPGESIAASHASCSGLSILLVDACRSVGVPARVVGVPRWTGGPGNHTWVEVWDQGSWHPVGAAESHKLGDVWFRDAAAKADARHRFTRIYATTWNREATFFPLAWDLGSTCVCGVDVTASYRQPAVDTPGTTAAEKKAD